jgi:hypothetical protein
LTQLKIHLTLTADALHYLKAAGNAATIHMSICQGCCGGRVGIPLIEIGSPDDADGFTRHEYDGVTVFIDKRCLELDQRSLVIGLDRLWGWQKLWVSER